MSFSLVQGHLTASLSRSVTEKDTRHNELWREVVEHIEWIIRNPKYRELNIDFTADKNF